VTRPRAPKYRTAIWDTIDGMPDDGLPIEDMVSNATSEHAKIIQEELSDLIEIATTKIIAEVERSRRRRAENGMDDFFREFPVDEVIVLQVATEEGVKDVHRRTLTLTRAEGEQYLDARDKPKHTTKPPRITAFGKLIEKMKNEDTTPDTIIGKWAKQKMGTEASKTQPTTSPPSAHLP
jgi:hypothetical protein